MGDKNRSQEKNSQSQPDAQLRDRDIQQPQGNRANENAPWRDDEAKDSTDSNERRHPNREPSSVAHDRGRESDTGRRRFSQTRDSDELGSELERETDIDESDDEDIDGIGRSNR